MVKLVIKQTLKGLLGTLPPLQQKAYQGIIRHLRYVPKNDPAAQWKIAHANCMSPVLAQCIAAALPTAHLSLIGPTADMTASLQAACGVGGQFGFHTGLCWDAFQLLGSQPDYLIIDLSYDSFLSQQRYKRLSPATATALAAWAAGGKDPTAALNTASQSDLVRIFLTSLPPSAAEAAAAAVVRERSGRLLSTDYDLKCAIGSSAASEMTAFHAIHALRIWNSEEFEHISAFFRFYRDNPACRTTSFLGISHPKERTNISFFKRWLIKSVNPFRIDETLYNPRLYFDCETSAYFIKFFRLHNAAQK